MKLLNQPKIVKPQDLFYLFIYLYRNPVVKDEAFNWLKENWKYVREISGDKSMDSYPRYIASSIKTEEDFEKYLDFFKNFKDDPALSRAIEMGENEIRARLELIKSDKESVTRALCI